MKFKVEINKKECIGCGVCHINAPDIFTMDENEGVSKAKAGFVEGDKDNLEMVAQMCPVKAISIYDEEGNKIFPKE